MPPPRARFHAIVAVLGALVAAPMLLGALGDRAAPLALADPFQPRYTVALALAVAVLALRRRRRLALAFAALLALPAIRLAPYVVPARAPSSAAPALAVLLVNVQTENPRHDLVIAEVRRLRPDVVVFEEVDAARCTDLARGLTAWPHRVVSARADDLGLAVFSALPLTNPRVVYLADGPAPSIEATVVAHGRAMALVATHPVPAMDAEGMRLRDAHLAALARHIPRGVATAVIGDLNATPWSRPLRDLRRSTGLVDSLAGRGLQPSWPAALPWIARASRSTTCCTRRSSRRRSARSASTSAPTTGRCTRGWCSAKPARPPGLPRVGNLAIGLMVVGAAGQALRPPLPPFPSPFG